MTNRIVVGSVFGEWTVLERIASDRHYRSRFRCRCACGVEGVVFGQNLSNGSSRSCGHAISFLHTVHGERNNRTPEYIAWTGMKQRCHNKNARAFKTWGGRGIEVCARWRNSYIAFLSDVGRRPTPLHSLGRIDNDGGYSPGNVRWELVETQQNNKRNNRYIEHDGKTLTLAQWAKRIGISSTQLSRRLLKWPIARALTEQRDESRVPHCVEMKNAPSPVDCLCSH